MKNILLVTCLLCVSQTISAQWQKVLGKNNVPYDASAVTQLGNNLFMYNKQGIYHSSDAGKSWKILKFAAFDPTDIISFSKYLVTQNGLYAVVSKRKLNDYDSDSTYLVFTPNLGATCVVTNLGSTKRFNSSSFLLQNKEYVYCHIGRVFIYDGKPPLYLRIRKNTQTLEFLNRDIDASNYLITDAAEYITYYKNTATGYFDIYYPNGNKITKEINFNNGYAGILIKDSLIWDNRNFSKDFGQTWYNARESLPLPEGVTHGTREGYFNFAYKNKIYAITNAKIYSSSNDGLDWSLESTELQKYCGTFNPSLSVADSILTFSACHPLDYCYEKFSYNILTKQITYLNTEIYPSAYTFLFDNIVKLPDGKLLKKNTPYISFVSSDSGATWQNSLDYPYFFDKVQLNDSTFYAFDIYSPRDVNSFKIPIVRYVNNIRKDILPDSDPLSILGHYNSKVLQKGDTIVGLTRTQDTLVYSIKPFNNMVVVPLNKSIDFSLVFFENKKIYSFSRDFQYGYVYLSIIGLDGSIQKVESLNLKGALQSISEPSNIWIANGTTAYNTKDLGLNTRSISTITSNSYYLTNDVGTSILAVIKKDNIPNEKVLLVVPYAINTPYISVDSGKTWIFFNLGIEKEQVLRIHQVNNYLFATTQNSLYRRSLDDILLRSVSGTVFYDDNSNNVFDRNEKAVLNAKVYSKLSGATTYTDSSGRYTLISDMVGLDTISISFDNKYVTITPKFYALSKSDTGKNFAIKIIPNVNDVKGSLTAITPPRPGFNNTYLLNYKNVGSTIANGKIALQYNVKQTFIAASLTASSNTNQVLTWNYANLQPNESRTFQVTLKTANDAIIGSKITDVLTIDPLSIDTFKTDNIDSLIQTVVGSYDPNDKQVSFLNSRMAPSVIDPSTELIYTIRFQNTGNYPADFVKVVDTLSDKLDLSTFRLIATSHKGTVAIRGKNVLTFDFNPIYLPDSSRDEAGSHGFVKFAIKPKRALTNSEDIQNTGFIYFDYNPAIVTNTIKTANVKGASIFTPSVSAGKLIISPNPAQQTIRIEVENPDFKEGLMSIYDLSGRLILSKSINKRDEMLNIEGFRSGEYICTIKSNDNKIFVSQFIKME